MPGWLAPLFENGAIALVAVTILVIETAVLLALRKRTALDTAALLSNALSGIALLLALWGALYSPDNTIWVALCLTAGFAGHVGDLRARIRRKG